MNNYILEHKLKKNKKLNNNLIIKLLNNHNHMVLMHQSIYLIVILKVKIVFLMEVFLHLQLIIFNLILNYLMKKDLNQLLVNKIIEKF